jgi:hypothetical protein
MQPYRADPEQTALAVSAVKALGLTFAGVDVLFGKDGPLICEVNSNAHFKTTLACTGVNVATEILRENRRPIGGKAMKTGWLLYDESDLRQNRDFAEYVEREAKARGMDVRTVRTDQLTMGVRDAAARSICALTDARRGRYFVISRQRDAMIGAQFEGLGVPVFNGSKVCAICNDKRRTHQFLAGHADAGNEVRQPPLRRRPCGGGLSRGRQARLRARRRPRAPGEQRVRMAGSGG